MAEDLVLKGTVCAHTDMVIAIATPVENADAMVTSSHNKSVPIETTTKISDLPVNLLEEILSRVPLKYMREVRLTCKEWDTLSKSQSFSKMHIDKLSEVRESESLIVAMIDYNLYLMRVVLVDNEDPIIERQGKLNKQNKISKVFHYDGLLLCVLKDDDTKVVVWNPYWGQTWSIECRYSHRPKGFDMLNYALGYEDKGSCRSYKFLRFLGKSFSEPLNQFSWYEIYDFDSCSWKTLDITPNSLIIWWDQDGVSLKGKTYWPALQNYPEIYAIKYDHIVCFDFTSESFGPPLRLPEAARDNLVALSCVGEEKLMVLLHNVETPKEFEIWITTKIETTEKVLWSKFLTVVRMELSPLLPCDNFFIDEEKKVAMGFSEDYYQTFNIVGEAGYLKKLKLVERGSRDRMCRVKACSYVPSLAKIKQPASRGQRKQQSDLEKQRFDQNMLSLAAIVRRCSV